MREREGALFEESSREGEGHASQEGFLAWRERVSAMEVGMHP
jgi:hypothetical protein